MRYARRGAQLAWVLIACLATALYCAAQAGALTACEAIEPSIEDETLVETTPAGALLSAQINPQNSDTTYEFVIVQRVRNTWESGELTPEGPRTIGRPIPADAGNVTVSSWLTSLQPGYIYWFDVVARNLAGETRSGGDNSFGYYYTGSYGLGPGNPYFGTAPSGCEIERSREQAGRIFAAAEAERRQQAREREEELARENAARYAADAAATRREEDEAAASRAATPHPSVCVVPALRGDTLSSARRAIHRAHCRLGKIREPPRHKGTLVVVGQGTRHGKELADGTRIALTLGAARPHRRI